MWIASYNAIYEDETTYDNSYEINSGVRRAAGVKTTSRTSYKTNNCETSSWVKCTNDRVPASGQSSESENSVEIVNSVIQFKQVLRERLKIIDTLTEDDSKSLSNSSAIGKYKILKDQLQNEYMIEDQILENILETN